MLLIVAFNVPSDIDTRLYPTQSRYFGKNELSSSNQKCMSDFKMMITVCF